MFLLVLNNWSNTIYGKSFSMRSVVLSVPRVLLRQCLANSSFVITFFAALSDGLTMPALTSSLFFALIKRSKSSASHSKMQFDNFPINVPYRGCDSLVKLQASHRIKCHISRQTCKPDHLEKRALNFEGPF